MLGLSVWVLPQGVLRQLLSAAGLNVIAHHAHWLTALSAAMAGAVMGLLSAIGWRAALRPVCASSSSVAQPSTYDDRPTQRILQVEELGPAEPVDASVLTLGGAAAPALAPHHGAAVAKLRDRAVADLSLMQLVERFAVALDDVRMARLVSAPASHPAHGPTHPDDQSHQRIDQADDALRDALEKLKHLAGAA